MIERIEGVRMRERVPAWKGGKWHVALGCRSSSPDAQAHLLYRDHSGDNYVSKDGFLTRRHEPCMDCEGWGQVDTRRGIHRCDGMMKCPRCHGTGCEPGTATEWEVEG